MDDDEQYFSEDTKHIDASSEVTLPEDILPDFHKLTQKEDNEDDTEDDGSYSWSQEKVDISHISQASPAQKRKKQWGPFQAQRRSIRFEDQGKTILQRA